MVIGPETKTDCAGEGQQQFICPDLTWACSIVIISSASSHCNHEQQKYFLKLQNRLFCLGTVVIYTNTQFL
jgi:hypothetical protein